MSTNIFLLVTQQLPPTEGLQRFQILFEHTHLNTDQAHDLYIRVCSETILVKGGSK